MHRLYGGHLIKVYLRSYQANAVDFALAHLGGQRRAVIQLPTGTGKSLVLLTIARWAVRQQKRVYLVAPTVEALTQLHRLSLSVGVRVVFDRATQQAPRLAPCVLTTYATAWRRFRQRAVDDAVLLLDECHHINYTAPANVALMQSFPLAIGASATPWSRGCLPFFDGNRYTYGLTESISAGHSAPYRIGAWQSPVPVDRPIIYVDNDSDLQQFCRGLRSSDYAIYQRRNARQIIARYRDEMIKAIVVRRMLTEGFDYAHCKAVYIGRKTRSRIAVMQMAGRALRPYSGKTATIFAINEDTEYLLAQAFQKAG